jgi:RNA-binding protein
VSKTSDTESYIQTLKPTIWVGKNGCTEELVRETLRQLETRRVIKIKLLRSCDIDVKDIFEIADKIAVDVLDSRGRMVVFGAKNRGKLPITVPETRKNSVKRQSARDRIKSFYLEKK